MISNQILQNTIEGLKAIARVELCVMDVDGKAAAMTTEEMERCGKAAAEFAESPADSQEIQGISILRFLMSSSWSIFWLPVVWVRMFTWSARWWRSRFRIC